MSNYWEDRRAEIQSGVINTATYQVREAIRVIDDLKLRVAELERKSEVTKDYVQKILWMLSDDGDIG